MARAVHGALSDDGWLFRLWFPKRAARNQLHPGPARSGPPDDKLASMNVPRSPSLTWRQAFEIVDNLHREDTTDAADSQRSQILLLKNLTKTTWPLFASEASSVR